MQYISKNNKNRASCNQEKASAYSKQRQAADYKTKSKKLQSVFSCTIITRYNDDKTQCTLLSIFTDNAKHHYGTEITTDAHYPDSDPFNTSVTLDE